MIQNSFLVSMRHNLAPLLLLAQTVVALCGAQESLPEVADTIPDAARSLQAWDVQTQANRAVFESNDAIATALVFVTHDCPIANYYSVEIRRIAATYEPKGIRFALVYPDPDSTVETIRQHLDEYGHDELTAYADPQQHIVRAVGATVTPEAAVVLKDGNLVYRGRIDDLYADFGKRRRAPRHTELRDALSAISQSRDVPTRQTKAVGCYIPPLQK